MDQTYPMAWPEVGFLSKGAVGHISTGTTVGCADGLPHMSPELNKTLMVASSMANNPAGICGPQVPSLQEGSDHLQDNGVKAYTDDVALHASSSATVSVTTPGLHMNSSGSFNANPFIPPRFGVVNSENSGPANAVPSSSTAITSANISFCEQEFPSTSQSRATWCQSYLAGGSPLDMDNWKSSDSGLGNFCQDEIYARGGSFGGAEAAPVAQMGQAASQQQMQGGTRSFVPIYGTHTGVISHQDAAATCRPRVRARRGQATDPHSIAERLRRERIAERMKALQELVPNFNKTDKASMLDEIIEYVKFLQLQVKVLSMSRLGVGAVAPLIADVPLEDGLAAAERQVTMLMEEDMGSAMQFLQAKGLCLMPVSMASAISSAHPRSITDHSSTLAGSSSSFASAATSTSAGGDGDSLSL